jgi:hypothetical protein
MQKKLNSSYFPTLFAAFSLFILKLNIRRTFTHKLYYPPDVRREDVSNTESLASVVHSMLPSSPAHDMVLPEDELPPPALHAGQSRRTGDGQSQGQRQLIEGGAGHQLTSRLQVKGNVYRVS